MLLSLLLAAVIALVLPTAALARSSDVVDADVSLRLAADGALLVTEKLTFEYDGHFEGSYRDIELRHGERISHVRFHERGQPYEPGGNTALGSFGLPGRYGVEERPGFGDEPDVVRVVWHYRATDETRTFELSYRVADGTVAYDDVIDVGWAVWGSGWDFDLERLTASFSDRALDPASDAYRVWGHPREVEGETVRGDGVATLDASDVESGTAVEFRVVLPREPGRDTSAMRIGEGDGLGTIVAEEQELDEDFGAPLAQAKRWVADNVVGASVAITALAALALLALSLLARERRVGVPDHLPEPPDEAGPALAYALAHEGADSSDTVLATLLDLVDRGYYQTSTATTEKEKLDLAISPASERPRGRLEPYEREVLEFFDALLDGNTVALSEMREQIPEHSETWRGRWEKMTAAVDDAEEGELGWDRDLRWTRALLVGVVLALFGAITAIYFDVENEWVLPAAIGGATLLAIISFPGNRLRRISADHIERCARWRAFERWTEDFPRLSDDPPATLELWKRILVYGVAFGTAERMIESGRIPAPVAAAADTGGHWSTYAFTGSLHHSTFDGSSFSSGFSSQVAPVSSSGGGGGFSGGGGGGSSGGGGGGSW